MSGVVVAIGLVLVAGGGSACWYLTRGSKREQEQQEAAHWRSIVDFLPEVERGHR